MLTSTIEYLQALRSGDYLRFLEWPSFIAHHYKNEDYVLNVDEITDLLVFEWINKGFETVDMNHLTLLETVYNLDSKPIRGKLDSAFSSIMMAAYRIMIYQNHNLIDCYYSPPHIHTAAEVIRFMVSNEKRSSHLNFTEEWNALNKKISSLQSELNLAEIEKAKNKIVAIAEFRYEIEDYLLALEGAKGLNDKLLISRMGVISNLAVKLSMETEITDEVKIALDTAVESVCKMQPASFEKRFLKFLSPTAYTEAVANVWTFSAQIGMTFFNYLQFNTQTKLQAESGNHLLTSV
ncbi:MAG: helical bundle domain-containing protein [Legionella sp.]|nr:helical bundle domain-containing protein [Legionella sp.]